VLGNHSFTSEEVGYLATASRLQHQLALLSKDVTVLLAGQRELSDWPEARLAALDAYITEARILLRGWRAPEPSQRFTLSWKLWTTVFSDFHRALDTLHRAIDENDPLLLTEAEAILNIKHPVNVRLAADEQRRALDSIDTVDR